MEVKFDVTCDGEWARPSTPDTVSMKLFILLDKVRCHARRRVSETLNSRYSQHETLYYLIKHDAARDGEWVRPSTPRYSNHYKRWPPNLCLLQHSASGLSSERKTCAFSAQRLHTSTTSYESVYTCTWSNNVLTLCMHTEHGSQQTSAAPSLY